MKFSLVTLGCDKNTVDSERYVAQLTDCGAELTSDLEEAEVIVVNTCGFIDAAKKESIDALLEAGRLKESGSCRAVVGVGCMVQRHKDELFEALPEVDLFLGAAEMDQLIPTLHARGLIDSVPAIHPGVRLFTGELPHVRYLKVSEGCDHGCAFCAIPLMRGRHRSFTMADVVSEAQLLEAQGAVEVNLVAQDLAHYGRDVRDGNGLPEMLEALIAETSIPWLRLLYVYSAGLTPRLLELMSREPRILPYLDMPIQHASDEVLKRMRRPERRNVVAQRVARIREIVPDVAIRTTCIVGFPGETDADFESLLTFLEEMQFERVGAFTYSPQDGTHAATLTDDVPDATKRERLERLVELQRLITADRYERRVGRVARAIVDRVEDGGIAETRTFWQADDIDGVTRLVSDGRGTELTAGSLVDVAVEQVVDDYDFRASLVRVVSSGATRRASRPRALPVIASTMGSYGR
ncbi:MAG TPA: 30S ribosomal protein S12 methylthiotransferase RimO [Gemmatimonadaceae bacterium]|nr:30S ribosomal protein S12 methylthiotransferase RimO [Gemmatimonadaceae bacterium]